MSEEMEWRKQFVEDIDPTIDVPDWALVVYDDEVPTLYEEVPILTNRL